MDTPEAEVVLQRNLPSSVKSAENAETLLKEYLRTRLNIEYPVQMDADIRAVYGADTLDMFALVIYAESVLKVDLGEDPEHKLTCLDDIIKVFKQEYRIQ